MNYQSSENQELIKEISVLKKRIKKLELLQAEYLRSEEALKRSEVKFRTLYDSTSDAVMLVVADGFLDCNKATLVIYGCATREEFCSIHPADLSPPTQPCGTDSVALSNRYMAMALENGKYHFEWVHKRADTGETFKADVLLTAMVLDGKPVLQAVVRDITERKRIEEELLRERDFSTTMIESSPAFFIAINGDGTIRMMNSSMLSALGYTLEEVAGKDYSSTLIPKEDREQLSEVFSKLITQAESTINENRVLTKDGRQLLVEWRGLFISKPDGSLDYFFGVGIDITDRKQAEEALRKSEETLLSMINATNDALLLTDTKGTILVANEVLAQRLGKSIQQIIGTSQFDQFPPDLALCRQQQYGKVVNTGKPVRFEDERAGMSFEVFAYPVFDECGKVSKVAIFAQDITERKRAEEALLESEQKFKDLSEKSIAGIYLIQDGVFKYANLKFAKILGYELEELIDKLAVKDVVFPEDWPAVEENMFKRISGGLESLQYEFRIITKSNDVKNAEVYSSRTIYKGKPAIIGTYLDTTERKQMERVLLESEERLRLLSDNLPNGMVYQLEFDESTSTRSFTYVSAGVERLHGITAAEAKKDAMAIYEQVHEEDRPILAALEMETLISMSNFMAEVRVRQPSGEVQWHMMTASPRRLTNNRVLWDGIEIDISDRKQAEEERERLIVELRETLSKVKTLSGLLPICASCKKIRNDKGYWEQMEKYIKNHSEAEFSHGICPECAGRLYPDYYKK